MARSRTNPELMYVLDYILERKSITDLAMSIRDQVRAGCFMNAAPGDAPGSCHSDVAELDHGMKVPLLGEFAAA